MVTCNLFGRSGNQYFMVAATIAYALKHKMPYVIPEHGLNYGQNTNYKFPNQKNILINIPNGIYTQPNHGYNEIPYFENVRLNGHFQSEKYFEGFRDEIRTELGFPEATINKCAVHVRRGDYLKQQNNFPVLPFDYYDKAVGIITKEMKVGIKKFVFFSDDIEWCKNTFGAVMTEYYKTNDDIADLKHMAEYKYMIIANSSYSLFASLINEKECVIAPKLWFGKDIKLKTDDLLPERFIKI